MPNIFCPPTESRVKLTQELIRVARLPRRVWTPEESEQVAVKMTELLRKPGSTHPPLRPVQAVGLVELGTAGGLFGQIRVGGGKSLLSFLAPTVTFSKRPLLLVPAALVEKTERDHRLLSLHWDIPEFIKIMSYEILGRAQAAEALKAFSPDLIILDECHRAANHGAAVTMRLVRHFREHRVKCVAMSGTTTKRSIHDYAHIMGWCLPAQALPIPTVYQDLEDWADATDERKGQTKRAHPGALEVLCNEEEQRIWHSDPVKAARQAFKRRLSETRGVVMTAESPIDASLSIRSVTPKLGTELDTAFQKLRSDWETPDGWPCKDGITQARHARELGLGFFYMWWNENGFKQCLTKTSSENENTAGSIVKRILRHCEPMIGNGLDLARAVALLKKQSQKNASGISEPDTDSLLKNSMSFFKNTTASATSAGRELSFQEEEAGKAHSESIMIMLQGKFEACSAVPATERWVYWATILKEFPVLFSIFSTAVEAARPPKWWLEPRRKWHAFSRRVVRHSRKLDTEKQVREWVRTLERGKAQNENGEDAVDLLEAWTAVSKQFEPNTVPVWIDSGVLSFAAEWARKEGGIVWVEHVCVGERLEQDYGIPYYAKKGLDGRGRFIDEHPLGEGGLVASIKSNSEGRNLQKWSKNLVLGWPPNGKQSEQLLGRTHRDGQEADEVYVDVVMTCAEHAEAMEQAVRDAHYVKSVTGSPQKLLDAGMFVLGVGDLVSMSGPRWNK